MSNLWTDKQLENLNYFKENLNSFLSNNLLKGKFIIIHNKSIFNSFDTFENALNDAVSKLPKDEFVIQQVISNSDTVSFLFSAINVA